MSFMCNTIAKESALGAYRWQSGMRSNSKKGNRRKLRRIQAYPWNEMVEESVASLNDDGYLHEQAQRLLGLLSRQISLRQCLLHLLRAEPTVVAQLLQENPDPTTIGPT